MKKFNIKKYGYLVLAGIMVLGVLYITVRTIQVEVGKYTYAWKEIQFAKQHPVLVGAIREKYELGLKALDQMAQEDVSKMGEVISPVPSK